MRMPVEIIPDAPAVLGRIGYFRNLDGAHLERLSWNAYVQRLNKGDVLIAKGSCCPRGPFAVITGQIHITLPSESHRSIRLVDADNTLGETILLMQTPAPYEAVATRKSQILVLDSTNWLNEVHASSTLALEVLKHLAHRRIKAMHMLSQSSGRTDLSRVADYIMGHRPKIESEHFSFELPGRKMDISSLLGMSNASFSRALGQLKKAELIHVKGACIQVRKSSELARLACT